LANPKSNDNKTAGYTAHERNGFTKLLAHNLVDSFRHFYPTAKEKYTFWSQMHNARAKNTGW
jgi:exonuclease III